MADRRMIGKNIYYQRAFLELPVSAQNLYTYLVLNTDNDGVVEAFSVMRTIHANTGDLAMLAQMKYIIMLDPDNAVAYINRFSETNKLDGRNAKASQYRDLLVKIVPDAQLLEVKERKKNKNSTGIPLESHRSSTGISVEFRRGSTGVPMATEPNLTEPNLTGQTEVLCINNNYSNQSSPSCPSVCPSSPSCQTDGQDNIKALLKTIEVNVSYDDLIISYPDDIDLLNGFVGIILDAIMTESETVNICGEDKPRELVRSQLMKLTYTDMVHVLEQFKSQRVEVKKKRQYILSIMYQTTMEMKAHYTNLVEADRHRGRG